MTEFSYRSEADVRLPVSMFMNDVAAALRPLLGNIRITFSAELSTFGDKGDLGVFLWKGVVVGVMVVKKPGKVAMTAETIIGECLDSMDDIRGSPKKKNENCHRFSQRPLSQRCLRRPLRFISFGLVLQLVNH